jgi:transposase
MTFYLGCDVSKNKVDVALVDGTGIQQWVDQVPNITLDLATCVATVAGNYPDNELCCVVESTGCYHHPFTEAAAALGIPCRILNPIVTKQQIKATIRGKKTDRTDAVMIARLGLRGEGRLATPEPYLSTKYYARSCQKFSNLAGSLKKHSRHITELLDADLSVATTTAFLDVQGALEQAKRQLYKDLAASAQGEVFTLLQTIPGVGPYVSASLIGEIQDMKRFGTAKALTAYAGLDPKIRQSGHTLNNTGKLTKRGSSYLRRSLFIAASVSRQYDPNMKAFYDKKRGEGKSYTVATCAAARKLLMVVRAVWLSGNKYDPTFNNMNQ